MVQHKKSVLATTRISQKIGSLVTRRASLSATASESVPPYLIRLILEKMPAQGVILLDRDMRPVYANQALKELLADSQLSDNWHQSLHTEDSVHLLSGLAIALADNTRFRTECRLSDSAALPARWLGCEAQPLTTDDCGFDGCLCTFTDITDQRLTNENLVQLSLYDQLTKLPNRSLLLQRLKRALAPGDVTDLALVFIDLDGFKLINDTLGREHGNQIIQEVSARINNCIDSTDLLARLGSDEFTAIIENNLAPQRAAEISEMMIQAIEKPFLVREESVYISASVGIAVAKPGVSADRLLQQADVAMYNAKKLKGNAVQYHSHKLTAQNRAKLLMGSHLHCALERNEFRVFYQPQLDIISNKICGSEALLRWKNPQLGSISPSIFVPLLEERGLIVHVGEWVLSEACHNQARWHRDYPGAKTTVSVNVSSLQLHDRHFLNKLKRILKSSGLAPQYLVLEITETILLDEFVSECRLLHEISALGVKIALDDFGTGYGSFSYLKKHPIDHIKIDRSFVDNLFNCEENKAITTSIIDLSHQLGKTVIAEGVDSQDELDFLMLRGCDIYQGFYTSKAIPSTEFAEKFLFDGTSGPAI
jgi:diguanylate cyclase (GGDEF)-like protein